MEPTVAQDTKDGLPELPNLPAFEATAVSDLMQHAFDMINDRHLENRKPLDMQPLQLCWLLRLWEIVPKNYRTAYDFGRFEKENSGEVVGCAFQRLNLRITAVSIFMGRVAEMLHVQTMLAVVDEYKRCCPTSTPQTVEDMQKACRFLLCDPDTDVLFGWVRNPFEPPPPLLQLAFGTGYPSDVQELPQSERHALMHVLAAIATAVVDVNINDGSVAPLFVGDYRSNTVAEVTYSSALMPDPVLREQLHIYLRGLCQLRTMCVPGKFLHSYERPICEAVAVADKLGLWLALSGWEAEIEWYKAWKQSLPELEKPNAYQPSIVCVSAKILRAVDATGGFVMHPCHYLYYKHVSEMATRRECAVPDSVERAARTAQDNALYAVTNFCDELLAHSLRAERLAMMIETILAPFNEDAYDLLAHCLGHHDMPLHTILFNHDHVGEVRRVVMQNKHLSDPVKFSSVAFLATSSVPESARYGWTGRPAQETSIFAALPADWEWQLLKKWNVFSDADDIDMGSAEPHYDCITSLFM